MPVPDCLEAMEIGLFAGVAVLNLLIWIISLAN